MDTDLQADAAWVLSVQRKLYQWSKANLDEAWRDLWNDTQPWFPLFLEWEVEYFHIRHDDWELTEARWWANEAPKLHYNINGGRDLARACLRIARPGPLVNMYLTGTVEETVPHVRRAIALGEALIREDPADTQARADLARAYFCLGLLYVHPNPKYHPDDRDDGRGPYHQDGAYLRALRLIARHAHGCTTDRLNLDKGEMLLRVPCDNSPSIQMLRNPQRDMAMSS